MRPEDLTKTLLAADPQALDRSRVVAMWDGGAAACTLPGRGELTIGRGATCGFRIEHPSVSRQHVAICVDGANLTIRDLGSANGTRVSGQTLGPSEVRVLQQGEPVRLGAVLLLVELPLQGYLPPEVAPAVRAESGQNEFELLADQVAPSEISVVLLGETGVGKEVTAARIHARSHRKAGPFLKLNCAALTGTLFESELFGFEKGAFTGANAAKPGLFESAAGGTVLLDEVTELTLEVQAKLLRAIENREVLRIGSLRPRPIDVRFVAATNQDCAAAVRAGRFRADLYYRLSGIVIRIPPLRERRTEIEPLVRTFLDEAGRAAAKAPPTLSDAAREILLGLPWPGNVRELRNVVFRASLLAGEGVIEPRHLAFDEEPVASPGTALSRPQLALPDEIAEIERRRIVAAMDQAAGNQTRAARLLGMSRKVLMKRLDHLGLPRPRKAR